MKNKKGGELICMRPDSIIEARFNLTKKQNDILDMVFATIENDNILQYEIDVKKYASLYNIKDKSSIYGDLKSAVKTFEGKGFCITQKKSDKTENRIYFSWFSSIQYIDGECKIVIELGQTLKKLLLEVRRAIYYKIEYTLNLNCIYSKRLYYYLKLYEDTGWRTDNLDDLRTKLECPQSYEKYANFRRFVLEPAYEEINGDSDIHFEYEIIKIKNKVTGIKFIIKPNNLKNEKLLDKVNTEKEIDEIAADMKEDSNIKIVQAIFYKHKITEHEASCILKDAKSDIDLIKQCYEYLLTKEINNVVGYVRKLVKGFNRPQSNTKDSAWNYEQRTYNFAELEKKMFKEKDSQTIKSNNDIKEMIKEMEKGIKK